MKKRFNSLSHSRTSIRILALLALMLTQIPLLATYWENGNLKFTVLSEDDATVSVSAANRNISGELLLPEKTIHLNKEYAVTEVGYFQECKKITSVTIPGSVVRIGRNAFSDCIRLSSVTISDNVTEIGSAAFYGCSNLASVIIPDKVTTIGSSAFNNCTGLSSVKIGEGVTTIGDAAFEFCYSLTSVTIPNSVTAIGTEAFAHCIRLRAVFSEGNLPAQICSDTFEFGINISIPAFDELVMFYVPAGRKSFYLRAEHWRDFKNIIEGIPEEPPYVIDGGVFYMPFSETEAYAQTASTLWCSDVTIKPEIEINGKNYTVTKMTESAFSFCNLKSVSIPNTINSISMHAFMGCLDLESVSIPNSVTSIEYGAFWGCSKLSSVDIPENVRTIGSIAFNTCDNLTEIRSFNAIPPICSTYDFSGMNKSTAVLYVPAGCVEYYEEADGWSEFMDIREMESADFYAFAEGFEWLRPWSSQKPAGSTVEENNIEATAQQLGTNKVDGVSTYEALLAKGYQFPICHAASKSPREPQQQTYLQRNYIKFGLTGYYSGITLPALTKMPDNGTTTISFDWCSQRQATGKWDDTQLVVVVNNGDSEEQFLVPTHDYIDDEVYAWLHVTIDLGTSVTKDSKITIRNIDEQWPAENASTYRWFLDNIKIKSSPVTTAVDGIAVGSDAPAEYFNLFGVRVANPANGIYIVRQGKNVRKVFIK